MNEPIDTWAGRDHRVLWHPFTKTSDWLSQPPLVIARAEGHYLFDVEGRRYFDGVSSLWVNLLGHRHPAIDRAVAAQLGEVAHTTLLGLASVPSIRLAERLLAVTYPNLARVFYSDNGSTAVEVALKIAFQYWQIRRRTSKRRFLALSGSYHGDTLGSVSVGGIDLFHQIFHPLLFHVHRIPAPDWYRFGGGDDPASCRDACLAAAAAALERHHDELAALIVEPLVQGAAGMIVQPAGYLRELVRLCRAHDVLVIFDEVAVGFGRTGTLFAGQQEGVEPDLLAIAKGVTGGYLPLAATLVTDPVFDAFTHAEGDLATFFHGHSYTGNPLACAAGLATLDVLEHEQVLERLAPRIHLLSALLDRHVAPLPHCGQVRQRGFMVGIELTQDRARRTPYAPTERIGARVCQRVRDFGIILRPLGSVVVLVPPLTTTESELDHLVTSTARAIAEVTG